MNDKEIKKKRAKMSKIVLSNGDFDSKLLTVHETKNPLYFYDGELIGRFHPGKKKFFLDEDLSLWSDDNMMQSKPAGTFIECVDTNAVVNSIRALLKAQQKIQSEWEKR